MNSNDLRYIIDNSQSRATDKLAVLMYGLQESIPREKMSQVKELKVVWKNMSGENLPEVIVSFE